MMQDTLETWDQKMHRLAVELRTAKAELRITETASPAFLKLARRCRTLNYEIQQHIEAVDAGG